MKKFIKSFSLILLLSIISFQGVAGSSIPPYPKAVAQDVVNQNYLNAWGDSLTAGLEETGSTATYPNVLAGLTNYKVTNFGIGGAISTTIAERQGGVPVTITVASNQLSTGSNSVTQLQGNAIVSMSSNSAADQILSTSSDTTTRNIRGTLCGQHGNLIRTASGGPPSTSETYTFTPDATLASPVSCAANSVITLDNNALWPQPAVFWLGRNNFTNGTQVLSDVAASVTALGHNNYIVMSVINQSSTNEISGATGYNQIVAINTAEAAAYGTNYFDVRSYLISQYNPAIGADVIDHGNDVPPYSLRAVDISGTLTTTLNTSSCTFSTSAAAPVNYILKVGTELIYITASSGLNVTGCTRGYGSTTAASYSIGQTYTGTDPLHIGVAGLTLIANKLNTAYLPILQGSLQASVLSPKSNNLVFASPPVIGSITPNDAFFNTASFINSGLTSIGSAVHIQGNGAFVYFQTLAANATSTFLQPSGNGSSILLGAPSNAGLLPKADNTEILGSSQVNSNANTRWAGIHVGTAGIVNYGYSWDQSTVTVTPATGNSITIGTGAVSELINPAGTLATLTVVAPANPVFNVATGGRVHIDIFFTQTITALTWTGFGSCSTLPTAVTPFSKVGLDFFQSQATWCHYSTQ